MCSQWRARRRTHHPEDGSGGLLELVRAAPARLHRRQAEVADLHRRHVVSQEDVVRLQVAVNDVLGVQVAATQRTQ